MSYEITHSEKSIPPYYLSGNNIGVGVEANVKNFATAAYQLVESELNVAYNTAWGNSANKVVDWLLNDTVEKIIENCETSFSDIIWKLCTWSTKNVTNKCPTNVYVYDTSGDLRGAIEDGLVTVASEDFNLYVDGDTKYITDLEDEFTVKYVATGDGFMDVEVTEFVGPDTPARRVEHLNVPLITDGMYTQNISDDVAPDIESYTLTSETQENVSASNVVSLLELSPADSVSSGSTGGGSSAKDFAV